MPQHNALGLSGGAGGEENVCQMIIADRPINKLIQLAFRKQIYGTGKLVLPEISGKLCLRFGIAQHHGGAGALEHIVGSYGGETGQQEGEAAAGFENTVHRTDHIRRSAQTQTNRLAGLQALIDKELGNCRRALFNLGIGDVLVVENNGGFIPERTGSVVQQFVQRQIDEGGYPIIGGLDKGLIVPISKPRQCRKGTVGILGQTQDDLMQTAGIEGNGFLQEKAGCIGKAQCITVCLAGQLQTDVHFNSAGFHRMECHGLSVQTQCRFIHRTLAHHNLVQCILRAAGKTQFLNDSFQRNLLVIQHARNFILNLSQPLPDSQILGGL